MNDGCATSKITPRTKRQNEWKDEEYNERRSAERFIEECEKKMWFERNERMKRRIVEWSAIKTKTKWIGVKKRI